MQLNLNDYVDEARIFEAELKQTRIDYQELLSAEAPEEDITKKGFQLARLSQDTQTIFVKIAHFLNFSKHAKIELDLSVLSQVNGLLEFISKYEPFETEFMISAEGKLNEKDPTKTDQKYDFYKKSIRLSEQFLKDESRN